MTDRLERLLDAYERRLETLPPRRPENNPWKPEVQRGPRRRTYRDPTGETAIGNIKKEKKS